MDSTEHIPKIEDYEQVYWCRNSRPNAKKAEKLRDTHIVHVNATYYGGGVVELLGPSTLLMNTLGSETDGE